MHYYSTVSVSTEAAAEATVIKKNVYLTNFHNFSNNSMILAMMMMLVMMSMTAFGGLL